MKIFRSVIKSPRGEFLIDAENKDGKLGILKVHPVVDGIVWASLPLCQLENVELLIGQIKKKIKTLA